MQSWLQKIADCDQAMWAGPVARAGFQATKVRVVVIDSAEIGTPCGTQKRGHFAAFYCSADQELYVDPTLGNPKAAPGYDWGQYWEVVSHEYGHSIQARTGIFTSAYILESAASSQSAANRITRRVELQAQCFSGLAVTRVGGMSKARFVAQERFETTRRLTNTHGTGEHQAAWFAQGHKYADVYQCNTFKASASDVS
jgi:predicted metalloprotease